MGRGKLDEPERRRENDGVRLFVAIPLPKVIRAGLEDYVEEWSSAWPEGRWSKPADWHVTLRFLGEVRDDSVPEVKTWLRERLAGAEGGVFRLGRTGFFEQPGRYVLWAGLNNAEWMDGLAARFSGVIAGCHPEAREFKAHITLTRTEVDRRNEVRFLEFMDSFKGTYLPPEADMAEEVVLYRSELSAKGAKYSVMERVKLS